jgi:hypothetical protein
MNQKAFAFISLLGAGSVVGAGLACMSVLYDARVWQDAWGSLILGSVFAGVVWAFLVFSPVLALFMHLGWKGRPSLVTAGLVAGYLPVTLVAVIPARSSPDLIIWGPLGALAALVFEWCLRSILRFSTRSTSQEK